MPFFIQQLGLSFSNYSNIFCTHNHLAQVSPSLVDCVISLCVLGPCNEFKGLKEFTHAIGRVVQMGILCV